MFDRRIADLPDDSKKSDFGEVARIAKRRLEAIESFEEHNRVLAIEDYGMRAGLNHWDAQEVARRKQERRPALTINRLPAFIRAIIGDQRRMRPSIKFEAVDYEPEGGIKNVTGTNDYHIAQVYDAVAQHVERRSAAEEAYDWAFDCALTGGVGYWRVRTELAGLGGDDQEIRIDRVLNPFSVYLDPNALLRGPEYADFGHIADRFDRELMRDRYPGANLADHGNAPYGEALAYQYDNKVRVTEYYARYRKKQTVVVLSDGRVLNGEAYLRQNDQLAQRNVTIVRAEEVEVPVVYWYLMSGSEVLEGPVEFPCSYIPIVPCYGDLVVYQGRPYLEGIIRHAHDAQRSLNYWETAATEKVALAPKSPWVGDGEAVQKYKTLWDTANVKNYNFLPYDSKGGTLPAPQRVPGAQIDAGLIERLQASHINLHHVIGRYQDNQGEMSNAEAGVAIEARQSSGDNATHLWFDNVGKAIRYTGVILAEMIPRVYDSTRVLRLRFHDDVQDYIQLHEPVQEMTESGELRTRYLNDLGTARFDVSVDTGPSFATQRQEAREALFQLVQAAATAMPPAVAVILPKAIRNMDIPGAAELAEDLEAFVPPEVMQRRQQEDQQEITPQMVQQMIQQAIQEFAQTSGLEIQQQEMAAKGLKAEADMLGAQADVLEAESRMIEAQGKATGALAQLLGLSNSGDTMRRTV